MKEISSGYAFHSRVPRQKLGIRQLLCIVLQQCLPCQTRAQATGRLICSAFLPLKLPVVVQFAISTQLSQLLIVLASSFSLMFSPPRSPSFCSPSVFAAAAFDLGLLVELVLQMLCFTFRFYRVSSSCSAMCNWP